MSLFAFDAEACRGLAQTYGTPCFAYAAESLLGQARSLSAVLPARVRLAYAVKANPLPEVLGCLSGEGLAFDCASLGELDRLAALGVEAVDGAGQRIYFAGPGKREGEIESALQRGVRLQAEGIEDLRRVDALARRLGLAKVRVNLRVQPLGIEEGKRILGGSGPSAFGVDEEDLPELLDQVRCLPRVSIGGLHGFAASNELDAARLLANHGRLLEIGKDLVDWHGLELDEVDLGGGLGVPYAEAEVALDLSTLGLGLAQLLEKNPWFRGRLILEPGRFLAAPCGVYLARVVRTKKSRGERFAILEGGINHLLRPLLTGQPFPVRRVTSPGFRDQACIDPPELFPTTLAGPLCTALDRLGRVALPALQAGDLLAFGMVGAYGATEAMVRFLDHPLAPEVWIGQRQGKSFHRVRRVS